MVSSTSELFVKVCQFIRDVPVNVLRVAAGVPDLVVAPVLGAEVVLLPALAPAGLLGPPAASGPVSVAGPVPVIPVPVPSVVLPSALLPPAPSVVLRLPAPPPRPSAGGITKRCMTEPGRSAFSRYP